MTYRPEDVDFSAFKHQEFAIWCDTDEEYENLILLGVAHGIDFDCGRLKEFPMSFRFNGSNSVRYATGGFYKSHWELEEVPFSVFIAQYLCDNIQFNCADYLQLLQ